MLSVIILGGTFLGCNANNSENLNYKELIINNQNCNPSYFDFSNQDMRVSLVDILSEIGFNVEWVNKEKATLQFNDSIYTLDISEKTLCRQDDTFNLLMPAPGTKNYFCEVIEEKLWIDLTTLSSFLSLCKIPATFSFSQPSIVITIG